MSRPDGTRGKGSQTKTPAVSGRPGYSRGSASSFLVHGELQLVAGVRSLLGVADHLLGEVPQRRVVRRLHDDRRLLFAVLDRWGRRLERHALGSPFKFQGDVLVEVLASLDPDRDRLGLALLELR